MSGSTSNEPVSTESGIAPRAGRHDLPWAFAAALPVGLMLAFIVSVLVNVDAADWWLSPESGFFEHATVVVLLPGIAAALYAAARGRFPRRWIRWWILMWALACIYFAGQEASWGQHYFGWGTPEALAGVNKQAETNLHNTHPMLNMQPRSAVELWMLVGGIVVPIARRIRNKRWRSDVTRPVDWFWPTNAGIAAASMNLVGRGFDAAYRGFRPESEMHSLLYQLGGSEAREFFIACFLAVWLCSFGLRARLTTRPIQ